MYSTTFLGYATLPITIERGIPKGDGGISACYPSVLAPEFERV
ncbi:MAG: hypothetical protein PHD13_02080 [Methanocellales archaeon]|nr:hypothetical protein [Methanocellales archaeon]MDD3291065.1 hypothetical protein [Methanocellales archaeon]MDD5234950.1 hypothetical protein [Methanocellales archaeon]MDD5484680.1 hypothetical protein [Methanocellales archaeon]